MNNFDYNTENEKREKNFFEDKKTIEELREKLKRLSYDELSSKGIMHRANKIGYVCPACGNGEGKDGTGIE